jgi:type I restriction enzyme, S subunit
VKEGWQKKTLGELCEIARGGSPRPIQKFLTRNSDGINWVKISDTTASKKYIYETKEKIIPEGASRSRLVKDGDFILSNSMSFGRPYIMRTSGCIHDGWLVLSDKSGLFDQDYLYQFLSSDDTYRQFDNFASGSTVRNLNIEAAKKVKVLLPSILEQRRIVVILDEAFEGIDTAVANTKKNFGNAHELFDRYLNSVFVQRRGDWRTEQLGKIVKFIDYRGNTPPKREIGIRLITAKNVKMGYIQRNPEEFVDPAAYDGWMTRGFPQNGDVLFTTEAPLGNDAQLDTDETVIIGQRLITFQPDGRLLDRTFLKFALMSGLIQQEIHKRATGATVVGIKASLLKEVPIHFPNNLSEQVATATKIGAMSEASQQLELTYKRKLDALIALKQAILRRAFAGELTANPENALPEAAE